MMEWWEPTERPAPWGQLMVSSLITGRTVSDGLCVRILILLCVENVQGSMSCTQVAKNDRKKDMCGVSSELKV